MTLDEQRQERVDWEEVGRKVRGEDLKKAQEQWKKEGEE